jgi:ketosteroid isomerase-like protein
MMINDPTTLAEITAVFEAYEAALTANDIATLSGLFHDSPHTVRFGVGENLYGFAAIREFRTARTGGSPEREVARRVITSFGTDFAVANIEFLRKASGQVGRQSQTWARTEDGWKIISAHVSLMANHS